MRRRTVQTVKLWVTSIIGGELVAFAGGLLNGYLLVYGEAVLPTTVAVGGVLGAAIGVFRSQARRQREEAYRAIRLGSKLDVLALLARRAMRKSFFGANDELGLCALEIAAGQEHDARRRLMNLPRRLTLSQKDTMAMLRYQVDLVARDSATRKSAARSLADLPRHERDDVEAYKAFLLARAYVVDGLEISGHLTDRWRRDPDDDVRAYGEWVRAHDDLALEPSERVADVELAARSARAAELLGLAKALDVRAAQIAAQRPGAAPYRS